MEWMRIIYYVFLVSKELFLQWITKKYWKDCTIESKIKMDSPFQGQCDLHRALGQVGKETHKLCDVQNVSTFC